MSLNTKVPVIKSENCCGCNLCVLACSWRQAKCFEPSKAAIRISKDKKRNRCQVIVDEEKCDRCMLCVAECPTGTLLKGDK